MSPAWSFWNTRRHVLWTVSAANPEINVQFYMTVLYLTALDCPISQGCKTMLQTIAGGICGARGSTFFIVSPQRENRSRSEASNLEA
jgi:hypothetical protein